MGEIVKPEDLKKGDRVRISYLGTVDEEGDVVTKNGDIFFFAHLDETVTIERLPPEATPLEVGEWVEWDFITGDRQILPQRDIVKAVYGGEAWVRHMLIPIAHLRRPNGQPIKAGE